MSFLTAFFYDRFMSSTEEACLKEWRCELLNEVRGQVLEIGAGTGASLQYYSDNITRLVLSEPDIHMGKQLSKNIKQSRLNNISMNADSAENISADDETFDYVVASLVCCSIQNLETGLLEIKRVLKTGGSLVFLEHVAADHGTNRRSWQNKINPIWRKLMGNCHLNRETEKAINSTGFNIVKIKRESMRKALPIVRPTIRGFAIKEN